MPRPRLRVVRLVVAGAGMLALGALELPRLWPVARSGVRGEGQVAGLQCDQGKFSYRLTIDGKEYQGRGWAGRVGIPCDSLRPGDPVPVYYVAARPGTNLAAANPRYLLVVTLLVLGCIGLVLYFGAGAVIRAFEEGERRKLVE